jgi:hypothetical protein
VLLNVAVGYLVIVCRNQISSSLLATAVASYQELSMVKWSFTTPLDRGKMRIPR